jgi:hypothetical protein
MHVDLDVYRLDGRLFGNLYAVQRDTYNAIRSGMPTSAGVLRRLASCLTGDDESGLFMKYLRRDIT